MDREENAIDSQDGTEDSALSRRQLLAGGAGIAGLLATAGLVRGSGVASAASPAPTGVMPHVSNATSGAVHIYLKLVDIKGNLIKGESTAFYHTDEIDIYAWSWGESNPTTLNSSGKVDLSSINLTKQLDRSTPYLLKASMSGTHLGSAVLTIEASSDPQTNYLVMTMTNAVVDSVSFGASTGGGRPTESVSILFQKLKFQYDYYASDGSKATPIIATWDVFRNGP